MFYVCLFCSHESFLCFLCLLHELCYKVMCDVKMLYVVSNVCVSVYIVVCLCVYVYVCCVLFLMCVYIVVCLCVFVYVVFKVVCMFSVLRVVCVVVLGEVGVVTAEMRNSAVARTRPRTEDSSSGESAVIAHRQHQPPPPQPACTNYYCVDDE